MRWPKSESNPRPAPGAVVCLIAGLLAASQAWPRDFQQIRNQGSMRVGVALSSPWALRDAGNELIGFEIDVARKLAEDMEVAPAFRVYDYDELIPALEAGEIDIIIAGLSVTPERALHVNFSQPYASSGIALATNLSSTASVERLEDLNSDAYSIAAVGGSVAAELARSVFPASRIELFGDEQAASDALVAGDVDAYVEDQPIPRYLALRYPSVIDVPLARPLLETREAFAVGKGDPDFLAFLNAWIVAREADTWLPTSRNYWFESLRWRNRLGEARQP